jgi:apoptosis-inducing factor 2
VGKRVVVAGLGDSGLLTAMRLARHTDVVGVSTKPGLVSGQELGVRITRPDEWTRNYWIAFDRFRALDRVRTVHGTLTGVDLDARRVVVRTADGRTSSEAYDVLVISTGVTNGFWRRPHLQSGRDVGDGLRAVHDRLAAAGSVIVVGGGAAAISSTVNLAVTWPDKRVDLYFPGDRPLRSYHPRVWARIRRRLDDLGVGLHPDHRAAAPDGFAYDRITAEPVTWTTGQPAAAADAVLWAVGRVMPNTGWLPAEVLDEQGFVRVTARLQVPGRDGVFAIGDVAATDPLRCSARNRADRLLAHNVLAHLDGRPLRRFRPRRRRWGSVVGVQPEGLDVFSPSGRAFRIPAWSIDPALQPWIERGIYRGVRDGRA